MALNTDISLRNKVIYEIYIRNHSEQGRFSDIIDDLDRIKDLGVDIIWFMPIHSIGVVNKKGSLGCPYSIRDYDSINENYGSLEDFENLIREIHKRNLLCMIDVVYNHTSYDSKLYEKYSNDFHYKDGKVSSKIEDWEDVIDIEYGNEKLEEELIDSLKKWVRLGVDGFRCDVASMVPINFWKKARETLSDLNSNIIWLAESVEPHFVKELRDNGYDAYSESELYTQFDILYDYDVHQYFKEYCRGKSSLKKYIEALSNQEGSYPKNYVKLKFLENHDNPRASKLIENSEILDMWTAFMYMQKGSVLIYAGQEMHNVNSPSLFEKDVIDKKNRDVNYEKLLRTLYKIKKDIPVNAIFEINLIDELNLVKINWTDKENKWICILNVELNTGYIKVDLDKGLYTNLIDNKKILVENSKIKLSNNPIIIKI